MASLVSYGACQTGCNFAWVGCYSTAGLVSGTVTAGVAAPAAAILCNIAQGVCMKACASKFLVEAAAETASSGGVMGPINVVGGVALAAGGWFGRGLIANGVASLAARLGVVSAASGAAGGATAAAGGVAATGAAATGAAATGAAATGAAATGGAAAASVAMPVILGISSVASVAYIGYQGYQWWSTPSFPTDIQVTVNAGPLAGSTGRVAGMAGGDVVVDFGAGGGILQRVAIADLSVDATNPPAHAANFI